MERIGNRCDSGRTFHQLWKFDKKQEKLEQNGVDWGGKITLELMMGKHKSQQIGSSFSL